MESSPRAPEQVIRVLKSIENSLDNVVDTGSDEDLFIASYLQGHFAVVARMLEMESTATLSELDKRMNESLDGAFSNNELEVADQQKVTAMWQGLRHQSVG